jgi:hypothetical protein
MRKRTKISGDTTVYVECLRDGRLVKTYDIICPAGLGRSAPVADEEFFPYAKANLLVDKLATPPFDGITFKVRR